MDDFDDNNGELATPLFGLPTPNPESDEDCGRVVSKGLETWSSLIDAQIVGTHYSTGQHAADLLQTLVATHLSPSSWSRDMGVVRNALLDVVTRCVWVIRDALLADLEARNDPLALLALLQPTLESLLSIPAPGLAISLLGSIAESGSQGEDLVGRAGILASRVSSALLSSDTTDRSLFPPLFNVLRVLIDDGSGPQAGDLIDTSLAVFGEAYADPQAWTLRRLVLHASLSPDPHVRSRVLDSPVLTSIREHLMASIPAYATSLDLAATLGNQPASIEAFVSSLSACLGTLVSSAPPVLDLASLSPLHTLLQAVTLVAESAPVGAWSDESVDAFLGPLLDAGRVVTKAIREHQSGVVFSDRSVVIMFSGQPLSTLNQESSAKAVALAHSEADGMAEEGDGSGEGDVVKDMDVMEEKIASLAQFHMVRLNRELKEARSAFDNARPPLASVSTSAPSAPSVSSSAQSWDRNSLFDIA